MTTTTTTTSGAADLRATFSEMLVDLPNTEPYTLFQAGFDAALAAGQATAAQQAPAGVTLRSMIEGMSVSVDVSTGDHDAGHRYFGTVTEVMECQGDKHGVTLLVQDAEPNFTATPTAPSTPSSTAQQASAHVLNLVQDAFAEVAMAYPKAFALHKVGLADTAVRKALAAYTPQAEDSVPAGPRRKDMLWSTAKMQERHDQRIENIVSGLERIKQEHAGQQPQKIDECYGDCLTDSTTCTNPCRFDGRAARVPADSVQEDAARESEYRRGYRHGYEQRDAEVRGAMA